MLAVEAQIIEKEQMGDSNLARVRAKLHKSVLQDVFQKVTADYRGALTLPLVSAFNADDEAPRPLTLGVGGKALDYKIDVEKRTAYALRDEPGLQAAWFLLLEGRTVDPDIAEDVVRRCAEEYIRAEMDSYFFPTQRRGRAVL